MRFAKRYVLIYLLFLSFALGAHASAKTDPWSVRACRTVLRAAADPLELAFRGASRLFAGDWAKVFDEARYRSLKKDYLTHPELIDAEPLSAEQFLARTDALFDRIGYRDQTRSAAGLSDSVESRAFAAAIKSIFNKNKALDQSDLRALGRLYYSMTRKIPYHSVEALLRLPTSSKTAFIDYQVENLFLRMAFTDVLRDMGIEIRKERASVRLRIRRAMFMSLVGTSKLLSWTNGEVGLARLADSNEFWRAVLQDGYLSALAKWRPEFEKNLAKGASWEVFVAIAGGIYSMYGTVELAQYLAQRKSSAPGVFDGEISETANTLSHVAIRTELVERWKRVQTETYGEEIDSVDLRMIQNYYDTLDVALLRETYSKAIIETQSH